MVKFWLFGLICCITMSCSSASNQSAEKPAIVETPADGSIRNSDIIRNPITAKGPIDSTQVAKIEFENETYDFGTVPQGAVVKHSFKFKNVGKAPLLIGSARSTCGCTIPKWPREPIMPGESGEIDVRFNTEGKKNAQTKPVFINCNTLPAEVKIYMKGNVTPKEKI